jgi:hypothetical protein
VGGFPDLSELALCCRAAQRTINNSKYRTDYLTFDNALHRLVILTRHCPDPRLFQKVGDLNLANVSDIWANFN